MESRAVDPVEFRTTQQQQWDSAATGWRKWSELIDRGPWAAIGEAIREAGADADGVRLTNLVLLAAGRA